MSEHAPIARLPLFAPPASSNAAVADVHERHRGEHAEWFDRVRAAVLKFYGGTKLRISTDEVWLTMERKGIKLPAGASSNLLGSFFSGWDRAQPVVDDEGKQRTTLSTRRGSNRNLLRLWTVK